MCLLFIAILLGVSFTNDAARALVQDTASVQVSADVGDTIMTVRGQSSVGAIVTVVLDGSVIGTAKTDSLGKFKKSFPAQKNGLHRLSIYARDRDGNTTDTITQGINLQNQAETTIDFFLPPSIYMSHLYISRGETIAFFGLTAPNTNVLLSIDNNSTYTVKADASGRWRLEFNTSDLNGSIHTVRAFGIDKDGRQSTISATRKFTLYFPGGRPFDAPPDKLEAPVILAPSSTHTATDDTITITGTAQPNVQLELYDGDDLIAAIFTDGRGQWQFEVSTTNKQRNFRARVCIGEICGPFSKITTVYPSTVGALTSFLISLSAYRFYDIEPNEPIELTVLFNQGRAPYNVSIDWGDGVSERSSSPTASKISLTHRYERPGNYSGFVSALDSNESYDIHYFSVEVREKSDSVAPVLLGGLAIAAILVVIKLRLRLRGESESPSEKIKKF